MNIPQERVTAESLINALTFYGYETAQDPSPDTFHIRSETGISIQLHLPEDQPFIQIATKHVFPQHLPRTERLKLVNEVSVRMHLCSFFLNDYDEMVALSYHPYQYGLNMPQFLMNLKRFSFINRTIWHEDDWKGIITACPPTKHVKSIDITVQTEEVPPYATCH